MCVCIQIYVVCAHTCVIYVACTSAILRTFEVRRLALHVEQGVVEVEHQEAFAATRRVDDVDIDGV